MVRGNKALISQMQYVEGNVAATLNEMGDAFHLLRKEMHLLSQEVGMNNQLLKQILLTQNEGNPVFPTPIPSPTVNSSSSSSSSSLAEMQRLTEKDLTADVILQQAMSILGNQARVMFPSPFPSVLEWEGDDVWTSLPSPHSNPPSLPLSPSL